MEPSMNPDEAAALVEELDKLDHDDFVVVKVRRDTLILGMQPSIFVDECDRCGKGLHEGDSAFLWARQLGATAQEVHAAKMAQILTFCSEDCTHEEIKLWVERVGFEQVAVAFYIGYEGYGADE